MARVTAVVVILLLLARGVLGSVAGLCEHDIREATHQRHHLGHHVDNHTVTEASPSSVGHECSLCHAVSAAALIGPIAPVASLPLVFIPYPLLFPSYRSVDLPAPERPKWR